MGVLPFPLTAIRPSRRSFEKSNNERNTPRELQPTTLLSPAVRTLRTSPANLQMKKTQTNCLADSSWLADAALGNSPSAQLLLSAERWQPLLHLEKTLTNSLADASMADSPLEDDCSLSAQMLLSRAMVFNYATDLEELWVKFLHSPVTSPSQNSGKRSDLSSVSREHPATFKKQNRFLIAIKHDPIASCRVVA